MAGPQERRLTKDLFNQKKGEAVDMGPVIYDGTEHDPAGDKILAEMAQEKVADYWWKGKHPWWQSKDSEIINQFTDKKGAIDWESVETVRRYRDISPGSNRKIKRNIYGHGTDGSYEDDRDSYHDTWVTMKDMKFIGGPNSSAKMPVTLNRQDKYSDLDKSSYDDFDGTPANTINQKSYTSFRNKVENRIINNMKKRSSRYDFMD